MCILEACLDDILNVDPGFQNISDVSKINRIQLKTIKCKEEGVICATTG